jgi:DNA (cytosine-5)-methyltransferase 1
VLETDKRGNLRDSNTASTLCAGYHKLPSDGDYVGVKQIGTKLDSNGGTQPYQQDRVYDADGIVPALNQAKSDLILRIKTANQKGYQEAEAGDAVRLYQPESNTQRGRVGKGIAHTLETTGQQGVVQRNHQDIEIGDFRNDDGWRPRKDGLSPCLATRRHSEVDISNTPPLLKFQPHYEDIEIGDIREVVQPNYSSKSLNETIERNTLNEGEPKALDLYNREARDESPTLTEPHHNSLRLFDGYRIRRLTPIECERLQGFPDDHTAFGNYDGEVKPMSNTQRYKQCGNAVTVDIVSLVAEQLKPIFDA